VATLCRLALVSNIFLKETESRLSAIMLFLLGVFFLLFIITELFFLRNLCFTFFRVDEDWDIDKAEEKEFYVFELSHSFLFSFLSSFLVLDRTIDLGVELHEEVSSNVALTYLTA
jgi:hypothetical protein